MWGRRKVLEPWEGLAMTGGEERGTIGRQCGLGHGEGYRRHGSESTPAWMGSWHWRGAFASGGGAGEEEALPVDL